MVALGVAEGLRDSRRTRRRTVARLGVERQARSAEGLHRGADLSLHESLGEHGEKVAEQQGLDLVGLFDEDRGHQLGTLQNVVATFEVGLVG